MSATSKPGERGFSYLVLLIALAVMAIAAQAASELTSQQLKRDREEELLFRGRAYLRAIRSYKSASGKHPQNLEDLLKDPRFVHRRHLRTLYDDPVTGKAWLSLRASEGGIAGVASSSKDKPLKRADFPSELKGFEEAEAYDQWQFK